MYYFIVEAVVWAGELLVPSFYMSGQSGKHATGHPTILLAPSHLDLSAMF